MQLCWLEFAGKPSSVFPQSKLKQSDLVSVCTHLNLAGTGDRQRETAMGIEPEKIRAHAYRLWEDDGRQEGRSLDHWLQAEQELAGQEQKGPQAETAPVMSFRHEKERTEEKCDPLAAAIDDTFPGSDPVAAASPAISGSPKKT
jgi:Protein of unknown function (DUF2934)